MPVPVPGRPDAPAFVYDPDQPRMAKVNSARPGGGLVVRSGGKLAFNKNKVEN